MRALPRKTLIERHHLIGSALPLPYQPGSRRQIAASARRHLSVRFELLGKVAELALRLRAETCAYRLYHPNVVPMETAEPSD